MNYSSEFKSGRWVHKYGDSRGLICWFALESDTESDLPQRSALFISNIWVEKSQRRKGLGTHLVSYVAKWAKRKRYWTIKLDNCSDENDQFFKGLGFEYTSPYDNEMFIKTDKLHRRLVSQ